MATILHNVLQFTGLVVGVPTALPHGLNYNGVPQIPDVGGWSAPGFTATADATNVIVTRTADGAASVNVYVCRLHSVERALPVGGLAGLLPFFFTPGDSVVAEPGELGNGSDGNVTIPAGTTTLAREMFYNNLTIDVGGVLAPNGWPIRVKNTLTNNGAIRRNGNNGTAASTGAAGVGGQGPVSSSSPAGYLPPTGLATNSAGGNGGTGAGSNGIAISNTFRGAVTGGAGGAGNFHPATNGGTVTAISVSSGDIRTLAQAMYARTMLGTSIVGCGSGGGGGGGAQFTSQGYGGGGGSPAGWISIACRTLTGSGVIQAIGGNGGAGFLQAAPGQGGGGGGGAGGVIVLYYQAGPGNVTTDVSGGAPGGTAGGGGAGVAGNTGTVLLF